MWRAAPPGWRRSCAPIGLNAEVHPTARHPIVVARNEHRPGRRTVMIYGHYDVQPVDPLELWDSPPFEPRIEDGIVFARGSTDNKGQIFAHILGIEETLREKGELPVNLIVLIEGEEEIGSAHLEDVSASASRRTALRCHRHFGHRHDRAGRAHVHLRPARHRRAGDQGHRARRPICTRASTAARWRIRRRPWRGSSPACTTRMGAWRCRVSTTMSRRWKPGSARRGRSCPSAMRTSSSVTGAPALFGEAGYTSLERIWARPTAEVNGIGGGFQGVGTKTVLPREAFAKLTFRLVPHQRPDDVMEKVKAHLRAQCPPGVKLGDQRRPRGRALRHRSAFRRRRGGAARAAPRFSGQGRGAHPRRREHPDREYFQARARRRDAAARPGAARLPRPRAQRKLSRSRISSRAFASTAPCSKNSPALTHERFPTVLRPRIPRTHDADSPTSRARDRARCWQIRDSIRNGARRRSHRRQKRSAHSAEETDGSRIDGGRGKKARPRRWICRCRPSPSRQSAEATPAATKKRPKLPASGRRSPPPKPAAANANTRPNATVEPDDIAEFAAQPPRIQQLIRDAIDLTRLNLTYTFGSADPDNGGMDCSGTIYYLLHAHGFNDVARDSSGQYPVGAEKRRLFSGDQQERGQRGVQRTCCPAT